MIYLAARKGCLGLTKKHFSLINAPLPEIKVIEQILNLLLTEYFTYI